MSKLNQISRRHFAGILATLPGLPLLSETAQKDLTTQGDRMPTLTPYLLFDGHCREAMAFYQACFGGDLTATKVKDSPLKNALPASQQDKILNARLKGEHVDLSSSDWLRPDVTPVRGNTVCLYLSQGTPKELKGFFAKLSEGADITDALRDVPYGLYGALNDKFGVRWMFHAESGR